VCPVEAICQERKVPEEYSAFVEDSKRVFTDPLPGREEAVEQPGGAIPYGRPALTPNSSLPTPCGTDRAREGKAIVD
jgi:hypothetical protein